MKMEMESLHSGIVYNTSDIWRLKSNNRSISALSSQFYTNVGHNVTPQLDVPIGHDLNVSKDNNSDYDYRYEEFDMLERAAYILSQPCYSIALVLGVVAIVANAICLAAILQVKHSMLGHFRIVISLIISDLLVDFTLITYVINTVVNPVLPPGFGAYIPRLRSRCAYMIIKALNTVGLNLSLLNLMAMAIDHYIAILKPFHVHRLLSKKRTMLMLVIIWILAFIAGFSDFFSPLGELEQFWFYRFKFNYCEFIWLSRYQEEFITFGIAIACFFSMVFIYIQIYCTVRGMDPCSTVPSTIKLIRNKRAVLTTLLILGTFMLCWLPTCIFNIVLIILTKGGGDPNTVEAMIPVLRMVDHYLYDLMLLNTLCDPIIYVVRIREVRGGYWMLFLKCSPEGSRLRNWLQRKLTTGCNSIASNSEDRRRSMQIHSPLRRNTTGTVRTQLECEDMNELLSLAATIKE